MTFASDISVTSRQQWPGERPSLSPGRQKNAWMREITMRLRHITCQRPVAGRKALTGGQTWDKSLVDCRQY
jgi:hypothetical protein